MEEDKKSEPRTEGFLCPAEEVKGGAYREEDPIIARHDPPPGRGMLPDMLSAKPFKPEVRVQDKPQEILQNPKENKEGESARFQAP